MSRPRKFDWDEAARLYAETQNYNEVARRLGVSAESVRRALIPEYRAYYSRYQSERKPYMGTCIDCGAPAHKTFNYSNRRGRCVDCANRHKTTSVREDTLLCSCCRLWLPDDSFPHNINRKMRRGRHAVCSPCTTIVRRDHRATLTPDQRERENALQRASRARRRVAS